YSIIQPPLISTLFPYTTLFRSFNNLRGDLPEKLGLTYADLKHLNPQIVCGHLSAYGREGSRKSWPGYDYLMQAEAGYLTLTGERSEEHTSELQSRENLVCRLLL